MHMRPLLLACLALPVAAGAQTATARPATRRFGHEQPVPRATAVRRQSPIVLDGKPEPAWRDAPPITEFRQIDPDEGKPASQRTDVRFLYDDDALYIGAKMYDSYGRDGVVTRLVRRDASFDMDYFELVIDSFHDHLSRAFFDVNPSGSKSDQIGIGTSCCDASWDPIWEASTRIDTDGWTAEIRIPLNRFASPAIQYRRGACRSAASSSAETSRTSGRGGARRSRADRLDLAISRASGSARRGRRSNCCPTRSASRSRSQVRMAIRS